MKIRSRRAGTESLGFDCLQVQYILGCVAVVTMTCGMVYGMKTSIDAAGRMVIPREIRRQAGLRPGMALDVRWHDGRIEIEPGILPVKLEHRDHLLVAVPETDIEELTTQTVEETRRALMGERATGG